MKKIIEEIKSVLPHPSAWRRDVKVIKIHLEKILIATDYLPKQAKLRERFYCIENDIICVPVCKNINCDTLVKYNTYHHNGDGYAIYCGLKCANSNKQKQEKQIKKLKIWRDNNPIDFNDGIQKQIMAISKRTITQIESTNQKRANTNHKIYGASNVFSKGSSLFKLVHLMNKQAFMKKYGVSNAMQVPEFFAKQQKSLFAYKTYYWSSGEVSHVQGYEPIVLKELEDKGYKYDDIVLGADIYQHLNIIIIVLFICITQIYSYLQKI